MKRIALALVILTLFIGPAYAQNEGGWMYLWNEISGGGSMLPDTMEIIPFQAHEIEIRFAPNHPYVEAITAAEFGIPDFPENLGEPYGVVEVEWTTELVIGDIWSGVSLAWYEPQTGGEILLGTITLTDLGGINFDGEEICIGDNTASGELYIVDDVFESHDVSGLCTTFVTVESVPTEVNSWSGVKNLYR